MGDVMLLGSGVLAVSRGRLEQAGVLATLEQRGQVGDGGSFDHLVKTTFFH
jgi:hypothetical protein